MLGNKFQIYRQTVVAKNIDNLYRSADFIRDYITEEYKDDDNVLFDNDAINFASQYKELLNCLHKVTNNIKGRELIKIQEILDDIERGK